MSHIIFLQIACTQELLMGSFFLYFRSEGDRSRKLLSSILLLCSMAMLTAIIIIPDQQIIQLRNIYFSHALIAMHTISTTLLFLYVVEVFRPGLLNLRTAGAILFPGMSSTLLYYIGIYIMNEPIRTLTCMSDLLMYVNEFNVWFRFVVFLTNLGYFYAIFRYFVKFYRRRNDETPEDQPAYTHATWMQYFAWGFFLAALLYILLLFNFLRIALDLLFLITTLVYGYLIYHGMFHKNPEPAMAFDAIDMDMDITGSEEDTSALPYDSIREEKFVELLPEYAHQIKEWMNTTKPYLRKDFKLMDVNEILLLNRSYLSRVFNKGLGGSFSQVVQNYRVEEAKRLLRKYPGMRIEEVAYQSGFSTLATFYAVFQKQTGVTPTRFKDNLHKVPQEV